MKLIYTIARRDDSYKYSHIDISVYRVSDLEEIWPKPVISFTWQTDMEATYWYAFRASTETEKAGGAERFRIAAGLLAKLQYDSPKEVLESLKEWKIERMVRDDRTSDWTKVSEAKGADYKRYMARDESGSCTCSAIARDDESAVKALIKEFARLIDSGYGATRYEERLTTWINRGKPVEIDNSRQAPDVRELEAIIKPMKEAMPEPETAQVA